MEQSRLRVARLWVPVLDWELETSNPRIVVIVGKGVWRYIEHLVAAERLRPLLSEIRVIYHGPTSRPTGLT